MEAVERTAKKAKGSAPGSHTEQKEDLVLVDDKPMEQQLGDPGAKVVGNFPFYYQFNPVDERISKLDERVFDAILESYAGTLAAGKRQGPFCLLDVGCNSGELTVELQRLLASRIQHVHALGWDIDPQLIHQATTKFLASQNQEKNLDFQVVDVIDVDVLRANAKRFLDERGCSRFGVTCLFSVTMWIHVNAGDDRFLQILSELCHISDALLIEPQQSASYRACRRRLHRSDAARPPFLDQLQLRGPALFPAIQQRLEKEGFTLVCELGTTSWKRPIWLYLRRNHEESMKTMQQQERDDENDAIKS
eukprot:m.81984 g.81984  ORF g.81984 m.81984 type:complete len:306 (-) comp14276_c0_seq1:124-1041(-)